MDISGTLDILAKSKHRITRARRVLLETIFKLKEPFSAHDIVKAHHSGRKGRTIDLVTVYRNLHMLEEAGVLCRLDFSDQIARYMVSHSEHDHHHHHIVCRSCHNIKAVDSCILEAQEQVLKKLGFKDVTHRLEFEGLCPNCA